MAASRSPGELTLDDRRWLHDKYQSLASEEGQLAGTRTSYFATIAAVLFTSLIALIATLIGIPVVFVLLVTLLSGFGILLGTVWAVLIHRTTDAQNMWREAARRLEDMVPPLEARVPARITLRSGATIEIDLTRPFIAHEQRFSKENPISLLDRVDPSRLMEVLPMSLIGVWTAALVVVWSWYFLR
jgi:hypothetical protein